MQNKFHYLFVSLIFLSCTSQASYKKETQPKSDSASNEVAESKKDDQPVFEGTIGNYEIVMHLDTASQIVSASYFYKTQLKDIHLDGYINKGEITLFKTFSDEIDKKELFKLAIDGDSLIGTWTNNETSLPVRLSKSDLDIGEFKRWNLQFERDSVSVYYKREIIWVTEQKSKQQMIRLGNGFSKEQVLKVNHQLDSIHRNNALYSLDCDWFECDYSIKFLNHKYLSFANRYSIYCGGAHPDYGSSGYTFDLKTLNKISDISEIYPNLDLFERAKELYQDSSNLEVECEYFDDPSIWEYYSWHLVDSGVVVIPSFPHAMKPCEIDFFFPNDEIKTK